MAQAHLEQWVLPAQTNKICKRWERTTTMGSTQGLVQGRISFFIQQQMSMRFYTGVPEETGFA